MPRILRGCRYKGPYSTAAASSLTVVCPASVRMRRSTPCRINAYRSSGQVLCNWLLIAATGTMPDVVTTAACSRPPSLMVHKRILPPSPLFWANYTFTRQANVIATAISTIKGAKPGCGSMPAGRLFLGREATAAERAVLHECNQARIRAIKLVIARGHAEPYGFFAQLAIHREALFEDYSPVRGQVFDHDIAKADFAQHLRIGHEALHRLCGNATPHGVRVPGFQWPVYGPVGESQPAAYPEHAIGFGERRGLVRHMQQCFLADDRVHCLARKGHAHDVAAHGAHAQIKAHAARQIGGACRPMRIEFDARHDGAVLLRKIARWTSQPGTKIGDLAAGPDAGSFGQRIHHGQAAIVILIEREQIFGRERIEMPALRLSTSENLFPRNRMPAVERQHMFLVCHLGW